jgi:hypothetical protein
MWRSLRGTGKYRRLRCAPEPAGDSRVGLRWPGAGAPVAPAETRPVRPARLRQAPDAAGIGTGKRPVPSGEGSGGASCRPVMPSDRPASRLRRGRAERLRAPTSRDVPASPPAGSPAPSGALRLYVRSASAAVRRSPLGRLNLSFSRGCVRSLPLLLLLPLSDVGQDFE